MDVPADGAISHRALESQHELVLDWDAFSAFGPAVTSLHRIFNMYKDRFSTLFIVASILYTTANYPYELGDSQTCFALLETASAICSRITNMDADLRRLGVDRQDFSDLQFFVYRNLARAKRDLSGIVSRGLVLSWEMSRLKILAQDITESGPRENGRRISSIYVRLATSSSDGRLYELAIGKLKDAAKLISTYGYPEIVFEKCQMNIQLSIAHMGWATRNKLFR